MYIKFDNFRVGRYNKNGETGFAASIYDGVKKIGTAEREDGKTKIDDIQVKLTAAGKVDVASTLKRRAKLFIDDEKVNWSSKLMVICLIENLTMYELVKRSLLHGNIVFKLEGEDFFQVLNIPNNPQNVAMIKKTHEKIELFGQDFVDNYNEITKSEQTY